MLNPQKLWNDEKLYAIIERWKKMEESHNIKLMKCMPRITVLPYCNEQKNLSLYTHK